MGPGSSTESYPVFEHIGLRENPRENLNQVTFPNWDSNPGHQFHAIADWSSSQSDLLTHPLLAEMYVEDKPLPRRGAQRSNASVLSSTRGKHLAGLDTELWNKLQDALPPPFADAQVTATRLMTMKSTIPFQCPRCGKNYRYKNSLSRHMRLECGKEPQFQCPFCPHSAKHRSHLQTHVASKHKACI
ncbi:hypothetical protein ANN_25135 [Periplaneta americana]|uniref:C2H2-type domain-containing protein n=1 Tax=Periplaneta americana TaxID=6978 RepID=A0ABQ8S0P8_PERAM|nr:hypothetical protein ANN_25135 [Periplaneta americana]